MRHRMILAAAAVLLAVPAARAWHHPHNSQAGVALTFFHSKGYAPQGASAYGTPSFSYFAPPAPSFSPAFAGYYAPAPAASYYPAASYAPASFAPAGFTPPAAPAPMYYAPAGCSGGAPAGFLTPPSGLPIGSIASTLDLIDRVLQWTDRRRTDGAGSGSGDLAGKVDQMQKDLKAINARLDELKPTLTLPEDVKKLRQDVQELKVSSREDTRKAIKDALDDLKKNNPTLK